MRYQEFSCSITENNRYKEMSTFIQQMMHLSRSKTLSTTNDEFEIFILIPSWIFVMHMLSSSCFTEQQASLSITNHHLLMSNIGLSLLFRFSASTEKFPLKSWAKIIRTRMKSHKTVDSSIKIYKANISCYASLHCLSSYFFITMYIYIIWVAVSNLPSTTQCQKTQHKLPHHVILNVWNDSFAVNNNIKKRKTQKHENHHLVEWERNLML